VYLIFAFFVFQSLVSALAKTVARRGAVTAMGGARRSVRTVPRLGTVEEMESEAVAQIRARIVYQKELAELNPHKSFNEEWGELWTWIKISIFVCGPICVGAIAKDLIILEHDHRPHGPLPEYMGIRNKEFPWECGECDIFDGDCWKKCRAAKAGN
jgi:cytochrome c oxidase subunit 6a